MPRRLRVPGPLLAALAVLSVVPVELEALQDPSPPGVEARYGDLMRQLGENFGRGDLAGALTAAEAAVALADTAFDATDPRQVSSRLALSSILMQSGRTEDAAPRVREAVDGASAALDQARSRMAETLKYLGQVQVAAGDLAAADSSFARAVALAESTYGADDPEVAKHLGNLAAHALRMGETERARQLFLRTLTIWHGQPELDPVYAAGAMANLAFLEIQEGRTEQGLEMFASALKAQEAAWGDDHPRLANMLRRYADALAEAGREAEARELRERLEALGPAGEG